MQTSIPLSADLRSAGDTLNAGDTAFELGIWLRGVRNFDRACSNSFGGDVSANTEKERSRELRILHSSLLECSTLVFRLSRSLNNQNADPSLAVRFRSSDLDGLSQIIRELVLITDSMMRSANPSSSEWSALNSLLNKDLGRSRAVERLNDLTEELGTAAIPAKLLRVFRSPNVDVAERFDFDEVTPRVGMILRSLEIVGNMLRRDVPVKPSLTIFAAVYEQTQRFIEHINNRLARFPNDEGAMFNSLDSASYSASLELKKVFRQELSGIVVVLPATAVYARVEAAYALLVDSFQQILVDLARMVDPNVSAFDYFPALQLKLDQSLMLRDHLWTILEVNRKAENEPESSSVEQLKKELDDFLGLTIRYLHYKDEETFERFSEEVHAARDNKDLVPILHRFGAYLETLFGQVCMRNVLAGHPFEQRA